MKSDTIIIRGARQHNLKNINLDLPRDRFIVITGLSGSGKSTLAFDTLYAEGQRRYVESLSTYARHFLERLEKPDVDMIDGLSPAIAIEQKTASHNPRSTVGTVTEIYDYLRLLFARIGTPHCHKCGKPITSQTIDETIDKIFSLNEGTRIIILAPLITKQKGSHAKLVRRLRKEGFARIRVNGKTHEIDQFPELDKNRSHTIDVIIDRLVVNKKIRNRLADSLELAIALSDGTATIDILDSEKTGPTKSILFNEKASCNTCGVRIHELSPASFSFNSPQGACPGCDGLGTTTEFDPDLIIPNPELSIREGAVAPWANRTTVQFTEFIDALTQHYGVDIYTPFKTLPERFKKAILYGSGNEEITFYIEQNDRRLTYQKAFEGIISNFKRRYMESGSSSSRDDLREYLNFKSCPDCNGSKLNRESRCVRVGGFTLHQLTAISIAQASEFFKKLNLEKKQQIIAREILKEISERLGFLQNVGLEYLSLNRSTHTLSGGENQRIRLATQIGSRLTGVIYVLDEPSIGLHQRDNRRLLATLLKMRDMRNTLLVVEHDEETIMAADHVVDMGPGAGVNGGQVVFSGSPEMLCRDEKSLTGQYLSGRKSIDIPNKRRPTTGNRIAVLGATQNNLKNIDVEFPLGTFTCVTGVSGSGKSTLVLETLFRAISQRLHGSRISAGAHRDIHGLEHVDKVINIDQSSIGKTPRSNPGTYSGLFAQIRELFSKTGEARVRGYRPGRFSFNVKGGRCEACSGDGIIKIEMHFLPDVYVSCDVCRGKRYNRETLEIRYRGKSIADVLDMTVNQSLKFFNKLPKMKPKLDTLADVGLGYIRLGQPATTLSGGEAQRIKLAKELSKRATGRTLYLLDEPTTGLHTDDIKRLLGVLNRLVDAGNAVVVIEHNLDVIKSADYIIDLGPEGGDLGGHVVASGTPEKIAATQTSHTGHFLQRILYGNRK
jgi:excinuclease ABC subunit A